MEFGEKVQKLRNQNKWTQEQLAEKLYVSRTAVSKWESGKGYPNIDSLKTIKVFNEEFMFVYEYCLSKEFLERISPRPNISIDEIYEMPSKSDDIENVIDREYYGRSATEILESTEIRYNEEQALVALIYDDDKMLVLDINDLIDGQTDSLAENDYVYFFSFQFSKE